MSKDKNWTEVKAADYPVLMGLEPTSKKIKHQRIYWDRKKRWYLHKDALHGEVEVYDRFGDHIGVMNPWGGWHNKKKQDKSKTLRGII